MQISGEVGEIRCKGVSVKKDNVVGVDSMNGADASVVPLLKAGMSRVCRFIENVVSGNPGIPFIMLGKFFPKPDCTVLEILVNPEGCDVGGVVRVPIL
jgi:hypothetical protein